MERSKGKQWLGVVFIQELFPESTRKHGGAEGTYSPLELSLLRVAEGYVGILWDSQSSPTQLVLAWDLWRRSVATHLRDHGV